MRQYVVRNILPIQVLAFFRRFSWYLEEAGATEAVLWPPANPGARVFRRFSWDLDYEQTVPLDSFSRGLRPN
jgi:hypothetical protein